MPEADEDVGGVGKRGGRGRGRIPPCDGLAELEAGVDDDGEAGEDAPGDDDGTEEWPGGEDWGPAAAEEPCDGRRPLTMGPVSELMMPGRLIPPDAGAEEEADSEDG